MTAHERTLAVIIGRAGSRGLPGKNALMVAGRPMVCHTIASALAATAVDRVVVSTDGAEIADAAATTGVEVIRRPPALATDTASVGDVVRHACQADRSLAAIIVILYANVPVRPAGLIDRAVGALRSTGADSVQSYTDVGKHHPYWMVTLDEDRRVVPHHPSRVDRRQDLPQLLIPDGGVIAVTRSSLFTVVGGDPHAFLGRDRRGIETPAGAVIDVDDPSDVALAELALGAGRREAAG